MNAPNPKIEPSDEDKPLDPATEKVRKKLVKFSAVFMGLNMLALMAVLAAIVYKISGSGDEAAAVANAPALQNFERSITVGPSAEVISATRNGNEVALTLRQSDGTVEIWFYNLAVEGGDGALSPSGKITVK